VNAPDGSWWLECLRSPAVQLLLQVPVCLFDSVQSVGEFQCCGLAANHSDSSNRQSCTKDSDRCVNNRSCVRALNLCATPLHSVHTAYSVSTCPACALEATGQQPWQDSQRKTPPHSTAATSGLPTVRWMSCCVLCTCRVQTRPSQTGPIGLRMTHQFRVTNEFEWNSCRRQCLHGYKQ